MKIQKILSFLLAVLFIISVFAVLVQAEGIGACTHMSQGRNQEQTLTAAVNADLPIVRDEVNWWTVEPVKGQLSLPERASWVKSAAEKGMKSLVVLSYGNPIYDFGKPSLKFRFFISFFNNFTPGPGFNDLIFYLLDFLSCKENLC